jgi:outer membrane protein TolC
MASHAVVTEADTPPELLPLSADNVAGAPFPIDLPTALRLAGANNLQIALASERVEQAYANVAAADAQWIPSLSGGLIYNRHNGRIQGTEGDIREVSRGSLFAGAGVGIGNAPLNGGSSGPARMFVDLSIADVLFNPLAARQMADAVDAQEIAVFNDTLLQAAAAYVSLVRAQSQTAVFEEAIQHSERLAKITSDFARVGEGYEADSQRTAAALAARRRQLLQAREEMQVASATLAAILRLDPTTTLFATDGQPVPIAMVSESDALDDLIGQGIAARPEVMRQEALLAESFTRTDQEHWRPWLPHVYAGFSGGGFGGNSNSDIERFSDRSDLDVAAIWELENFGLGNAARRRQRESEHRQAHLAGEQTRDRIAMEVARAYHRVRLRRQQIDAVAPQLTAAERALQLNFDGIRGAELRPIEAQQAINALIDAKLQHVDSVLDYNAAQFELLRAIGLPPQAAAAE